MASILRPSSSEWPVNESISILNSSDESDFVSSFCRQTQVLRGSGAGPVRQACMKEASAATATGTFVAWQRRATERSTAVRAKVVRVAAPATARDVSALEGHAEVTKSPWGAGRSCQPLPKRVKRASSAQHFQHQLHRHQHRPRYRKPDRAHPDVQTTSGLAQALAARIIQSDRGLRRMRTLLLQPRQSLFDLDQRRFLGQHIDLGRLAGL